MVFPASEGYPLAFENPVVLRAAAILPAAGAWDATPLEINTVGVRYAQFYLSYMRAAVGGAVDFYFEISAMSVDALAPPIWWRQTIFAGGVVAANVDIQSRLQCEYITYGATSALLENFVYGVVDLGLSAERIRMFARESGVVGNPGAFGAGAIFMRGA
jgi:hypothetical protein